MTHRLMRMTDGRQKLTNFVGRQCRPTDKNLSCVIEKLVNFCWQTKVGQQEKIFQHDRKPSKLSSGILDCDWSATLFTNMESEWTDEVIYKLIQLYELHACLYDPSDRNYRNRDLKRQKESEIVAASEKPGKNVHAVTCSLCSRTWGSLFVYWPSTMPHVDIYSCSYLLLCAGIRLGVRVSVGFKIITPVGLRITYQ